MVPMPASTSFRARPGVIILTIGAAAMAICYFLPIWPHHQYGITVRVLIAALTIVALLIWWMLFARVPLPAKLLGLAVAASPFGLYHLKGFSGDWQPIFEPRFWGHPKSFHIVNSAAGLAQSHPDFPQFLGANRDGRLTGPALDADWNAHPPQVIWRKSLGPAWSGFVVAGNKAITQEERDGQEWVVCLELTTGNELWRTGNAGHFSEVMAGDGPRATPTISGDRLFTLGSTGVLNCLQLADGKLVWTHDLKADAGVSVPPYGFASSPLLYDGKVMVSAGGTPNKSLLAYRASDGQPAWAAGNGKINYSSPFLRTVAGHPQILMFNSEAMAAHDPATGALLWEYPWPSGRPNVSQPLVVNGNQVFISSGYAYGSELVEVKPASNGTFTVERLWKSPRFQAKFSNPVEREGFIYGVSDGDLACLDTKDGSRRWKSTHYGHGQCLMIGDLFLQMAEEPGVLILLRPTPEAPNELGRFPVFEAKTWNPLALAGDLLLVRNDREAACLRLPLAPVK